MSEILQANIFFFIASIATVVFCILVSLILFQILKITKSFRAIIDRLEAGSELLAQDVANVRELVASGGIFTRMFQFMMGAKRGRGRSHRHDQDES